MQPVGSTPGGLIRHRRLHAGLSQQELADLAGVSVRSLRDIETGHVSRPRASSLRRLATALDVTDDELSVLLEAVQAGGRADPRTLHIAVLGPLLVRYGDEPVEIRSPMQRQIFGLLALQPGQRVSREEIVDVLWGDRPPKTYLNLIQGHVAALRRLLRPGRGGRGSASIATLEHSGYTLAPEGARLDLVHFDDLVQGARAARSRENLVGAQELFGRALCLWRGPVLAGAGPWVRHHPVAVAIDRRRMDAALAFADLGLEGGNHRSVAAQLQGLVAAEPLHEGLHARLMLAMARDGDQAGALRLFADVRRRLADELGIEPGHELRAAHLQVLRQRLPGLGSGGEDVAQLSPSAEPPRQLPLDARGFGGRLSELARLDALLATAAEHPSALTVAALSGTAGVGKTTLAVHWAHRVRDRFPDGQIYVNLRGFDATGPAMEPAEAIRSFLDALGVPPERIPETSEAQKGLYRSLLTGRRILLVLDNARDAEQVRPLLPGAPTCFVVVTSRDQLSGLVAIEGANPLTLDLLSAAEGRELLARRLGAERADAEPGAVDELIAQCSRLPLALAIVTARAVTNPRFSLAAMADELREAGNRLDAFSGGDPATHVRTVFSWSYRTLSGEAARLFRLLSINPGPDIGVGAVARLAGTSETRVRPLLAELCRANLLTEHVVGRFAFHDLLRLYAAERNREEDDDERTAAAQRLYDHYAHTTRAASRLLYPNLIMLPQRALPADPAPVALDGHASALAWLDVEHVNLVAAITHAAEHGPRPAAWLIADGLRGYLARRRHSVHWFTVAEAGMSAALAEGDLLGQAALHLSTAHAHNNLAHDHEVIGHLRQVVELADKAGWAEGRAVGLGNIGSVYSDLGRLEDAHVNLLRALGLWEQIGAAHSSAITLNNLGNLDRVRGRLREATGYLGRALETSRQSGVRTGLSSALESLGQACHDLGRLTVGAEHLREALRLARRIGDNAGEAKALSTLSRIDLDAGRLSEALDAARSALRLSEELMHRQKESAACNALAACCHRLGRHQDAIAYFSRALRLAQEAGVRYEETEALIGLSTVHTHLGAHPKAAAHARDALALARKAGFRVREGQALTALAEVCLGRGDIDEAADHATHAIRLHRETGHRLGEARALMVLGHALLRRGGPGVAVEHWREALTLFADIGTPEADRVRALIGEYGPGE